MLTAKGYGRSTKGGRKRLEEITVGKKEKNDYYFAVFVGYHGFGAAIYAYNNLWDNIKRTEGFYSHEEEKIKEAIRGGFCTTQGDMYRKSPCLHHADALKSLSYGCVCIWIPSNHRLYTPYGYETRKRHRPYAGFAPPYCILRPFTANSSLQTSYT